MLDAGYNFVVFRNFVKSSTVLVSWPNELVDFCVVNYRVLKSVKNLLRFVNRGEWSAL
jgi:hypothetical protein